MFGDGLEEDYTLNRTTFVGYNNLPTKEVLDELEICEIISEYKIKGNGIEVFLENEDEN